MRLVQIQHLPFSVIQAHVFPCEKGTNSRARCICEPFKSLIDPNFRKYNVKKISGKVFKRSHKGRHSIALELDCRFFFSPIFQEFYESHEDDCNNPIRVYRVNEQQIMFETEKGLYFTNDLISINVV